jgi:hypothetical protein
LSASSTGAPPRLRSPPPGPPAAGVLTLSTVVEVTRFPVRRDG